MGNERESALRKSFLRVAGTGKSTRACAIAGLELGTGLPVDPVSPEEAAAQLLDSARAEAIETGVAEVPARQSVAIASPTRQGACVTGKLAQARGTPGVDLGALEPELVAELWSRECSKAILAYAAAW